VANPKNKWDQPSAPPAPMFFGKKERDLVKQVNDELSERIIGQPIAYYPISIEDSNFNDTYGEAIEKVSLPPVRLYAYVVVENEQSNERYGYEYQTKLTVNFSRRRLVEDQDLFVRVGDFIQYGDYFYEIVKTYNDTRYYFGQVEHKFQISAECIRARSGNFRVIPAVTRPTDTPTIGGAAGTPPPRAAPYPPLTATYITVTAESKLPNERILTAGAGITITDAGAGGALTLAATGQNAIGPTGSLQLTTGAGGFSGSANLLFLTSSDTIALTGAVEVVGTMSASSTISAKTLSASLMNLQPTSGSLAGGASYLGLNTSNNLILTAAATTATSPGGATTQIQYNNAGAFGGSSNLTFNGTTLTGSYTGSLAEFITLSASLMNLVPKSGSLGGGSSYLGLDVSNNLILTSAATTATSPGGSTTQVQYNSGGSFAGSSNFTFDGTTITAAGLQVDGNTVLGDASGDSVTINAQTIALANVAAGTDNTVLVYNGSSIVSDEIDSRVWGSTLVDASGTPANNQVGIWTDANTIEGSTNLTFNGTTLTGSYTGSLAEFSTLSASAFQVLGNTVLGDASGDSVTITAQTIVLTNIVAGTDNTVLVYDGSSIVTDEIDSRVWGSTLVDASGTPVDNQVGIWTDANTMEGDAGLTYNSTSNLLALTGTMAVSSSADQQLFRVDGATAGNVLFVTGSGRVGIGTTTPTHPLTVVGASYLSGALVHKRTAVTNDYSVALTDYYLGVDTTSNTVDLTLPAASTAVEGQTYVVKDEGGNAAANAITVLRSASDTIDGNTSVTLDVPYSALSLYTDGANWFIY